MALEIKPVEGKVALKILDEDDEDNKRQSMGQNDDDWNKTVLAMVVGAGKGVPAKKGDTVLVRGYVKNEPKLDDDTVISDAYAILAVVTA